jgi:hypothetical protein
MLMGRCLASHQGLPFTVAPFTFVFFRRHWGSAVSDVEQTEDMTMLQSSYRLREHKSATSDEARSLEQADPTALSRSKWELSAVPHGH